MQTKVVISQYSPRLALDIAELLADDVLVARATGEIIEITPPKKSSQTFMVAICDQLNIGHTFFHCSQVEDKRIRMG